MPKLKFLLVVSVVLGAIAFAGERPTGQIVSTGAAVTNLTTAVPFSLPISAPVMLQAPDAGVWYAIDGRATCNPGFPQVLLPAGGSIDTSVGKRNDAGVNNTVGRIVACCEAGSTACVLNVFALEGTEP